MSYFAPVFQKSHRPKHHEADHSFEKRLALILVAMGLFLGLNAWLVSSGHDSGSTPWKGLHPALVASR